MRRTEHVNRKTASQVLRSILCLPNLLFIGLISLYRKAISPLLPSVCRFEPRCSQYALQAFGKYNFIKALALSVWRIMRCNPFCKGGYDPLP